MPIREKLNLTKREARDILDEGPTNYTIVQDHPVSHGRWDVMHELVIRRISDGRYFKDIYYVGATESQDESPWEYTKPNFVEVFPVEKMVVVYE